MNAIRSKIDQLITELCPNGVKFKKLKEVAKIKNGKDWKKLSDGNIPVYGTGGVIGYVGKFTYDKPTVLIPRKGSITNIFYLDKPFWNVDTIYYTEIDTKQIVPKFFYYVIKNIDLEKLDTGSGRPSLTQAILDKIKLPVPPLEIQNEIVKILNKFTELEAELEAELEVRVKQYEYYRKNLLENNINVEHKTLGDSFSMVAGRFISANNISKNQDTNKKFPCYGGNGLRGYVSKKSHEGRYVLIGRQGALCGNTKLVNGEFYATEHAVVVTPKRDIDINWAFHMLTYMNLNQYASKSAQPGLAVGNLEKVKIRVPKLNEQRRIALMLDKFDALVNDISIGLPAELNARRQQYEYYRNKLLTFKEYVG